ncbi:putative aminotransferase [Bacillus sp. TS-2]|nr:putative aminotransferase [Bacillus sp. TS-2]
MAEHHDDLLEKDREYVWHSMKPYHPERTIVVKKAEGVWITDSKNRKYLDAMSGLWCVNIGYGRKELAEVAKKQMEELAYFPLTQSHSPAIELAEKLNNMLDGQYVIFFSNSGSEANETAIKIARQYYHQIGQSTRYKILSRYRSYHGNTLATLAATGQAERKYKFEPLATGFIHVMPPDLYRHPLQETVNPRERRETKAIEEAITWEMKETVAAVIMEPIISGGGILLPPEDYLKAVEEICRENGVLLILDEVICGFGRTGKPFGFMNYGIQPDIITMAKGITSGYLPLAATAVKKEIYDQFKGGELYDYFRHITTFGGHPASCAVALENLNILEQEKLYQRSHKSGKQILQILKQRLLHTPYVGHIRGKGLLIGIELVKDKKLKTPLDVSYVNEVISYCFEKGLIIGKNGATVAGFNNVLTLAPPLTISEQEIQFLLEILVQSINRLEDLIKS